MLENGRTDPERRREDAEVLRRRNAAAEQAAAEVFAEALAWVRGMVPAAPVEPDEPHMTADA